MLTSLLNVETTEGPAPDSRMAHLRVATEQPRYNGAVPSRQGDLAHFSFIILVKDTAIDHVLGSSVRFAVLSTPPFPAE
jgi:hypothetical protein